MMITTYITLLALIFLYLYWILPNRFRFPLILVANLLVLVWFDKATLAVFLVDAVIVLISSVRVARLDSTKEKTKRRTWLAFVTLALLSPMVVTRVLASTDSTVVRPVALSYFTLMLLGYFLEGYRGTIKPLALDGTVVGFSSFFLISTMGPIERYQRLAPQLREPRRLNYSRAIDGLFLISLGVFKKFVIADRLASFVADPNHQYLHYAGLELWFFCVLAFIQIFCDFSGWIDIIRGFAKLMGIELVDNFNQPYFARNIPDIWRRWHISLVDWLRDFVYTPVALRTKNLYLATFLVMLLVGLWHSFTWNALAWAVYWSALYSLAILFRQKGWSSHLPSLVKSVGVFAVMALSTVLLLPRNLGELSGVLSNLIRLHKAGEPGIFDGTHLARIDSTIALIGFGLVIGLETLHRRARSKYLFALLAAIILLLTMSFATGSSKAFIYLRY